MVNSPVSVTTMTVNKRFLRQVNTTWEWHTDFLLKPNLTVLGYIDGQGLEKGDYHWYLLVRLGEEGPFHLLPFQRGQEHLSFYARTKGVDRIQQIFV